MISTLFGNAKIPYFQKQFKSGAYFKILFISEVNRKFAVKLKNQFNQS